MQTKLLAFILNHLVKWKGVPASPSLEKSGDDVPRAPPHVPSTPVGSNVRDTRLRDCSTRRACRWFRLVHWFIDARAT